MLVNIHNESFVDINVHPWCGSSTTAFRGSLLKPGLSRHGIASPRQSFDFFVAPTAHRQRLASMTDGLMTRLAFIANKGQELDADGGKTKLFDATTIGAGGV